MPDKATILLVDDVPANIAVLSACLKDTYHLKAVTSGEKCLELIDQGIIPDLILLDIQMPHMDGYEVCQRLKKNHMSEAIPIIFVTTKSGDKDEEKGLNLGAVDYITKPVSPAIVLARVNTHITLKQHRDLLHEMAFHDQLTWLYNRHYLLEVADKLVTKAIRKKSGLCLMMIDIDHFKSINDTHGHVIGDSVLIEFAKLLRSHNRNEDISARLGGEEFVVLLEDCNLSNAEKKAEKLRNTIENLKPEGITVTVSIGVAQLVPSDKDFTVLLNRADVAVYKAKAEGRNKVVVSYD